MESTGIRSTRSANRTIPRGSPKACRNRRGNRRRKRRTNSATIPVNRACLRSMDSFAFHAVHACSRPSLFQADRRRHGPVMGSRVAEGVHDIDQKAKVRHAGRIGMESMECVGECRKREDEKHRQEHQIEQDAPKTRWGGTRSRRDDVSGHQCEGDRRHTRHHGKPGGPDEIISRPVQAECDRPHNQEEHDVPQPDTGAVRRTRGKVSLQGGWRAQRAEDPVSGSE